MASFDLPGLSTGNRSHQADSFPAYITAGEELQIDWKASVRARASASSALSARRQVLSLLYPERTDLVSKCISMNTEGPGSARQVTVSLAQCRQNVLLLEFPRSLAERKAFLYQLINQLNQTAVQVLLHLHAHAKKGSGNVADDNTKVGDCQNGRVDAAISWSSDRVDRRFESCSATPKSSRPTIFHGQRALRPLP